MQVSMSQIQLLTPVLSLRCPPQSQSPPCMSQVTRNYQVCLSYKSQAPTAIAFMQASQVLFFHVLQTNLLTSCLAPSNPPTILQSDIQQPGV